MNQLVSKLATLGQRQNNYAQVDTQVSHMFKIDLNLNLNLIFISTQPHFARQVNIENLNLKIGLDEAAFLLEPPSTALSRTVEDYYRQVHVVRFDT